MSDEARASDDLREEAKALLSYLLKIPDDTNGGSVERLVDCIIGAAVLEVANMMRKAAKK